MRDNAAIEDLEGPEAEAAERDRARARDAALVRAAVAGDPSAFGHLYEGWFDRVFHLAAGIVRDREVAAEVCQDAFLAAWRGLGGLRDPATFGGWLLRIARNASYDRAQREGRSRPVDGEGLAMIEETRAIPSSAPAGFDAETRVGAATDPQRVAADRETAELVQQVVAALSERDGQVLDLQLRFGMAPTELAEVMGINRNAANQLCHRVRQRFGAALRARLLWRGPAPACPQLAGALAAAGIGAYGAAAVPVANAHREGCARCQERSRLHLQPSALFAAVPLVAPPASLRATVAERLAAQGVPVDPTSHAPAPPQADAGPGSSDPDDPASATRPGDGPSGAAGPGAADLIPPPASDGLDVPDTVAGRAVPRWAAAAVLVIAIGLVAAFLTGSDDGEAALRADGTTSTTATSPVAVERRAGPTSTEPLEVELPPPATDPEDEAPETSSHAPGTATPPGGSASTAPDPTTPPTTVLPRRPGSTTTISTTVPRPVIERFELWNTAARVPGYDLGPEAPRLRWDVTGADAVAVWAWHDAGSGPTKVKQLATSPSGELVLCPGTESGGYCSLPVGRYTFTLEARNAGGAVTTDQANPPGYDVVPSIIL